MAYRLQNNILLNIRKLPSGSSKQFIVNGKSLDATLTTITRVYDPSNYLKHYSECNYIIKAMRRFYYALILYFKVSTL